ncbi:MAG: toll/interleukin-1 receptor domain-containing protein [Hellea sp.]
MKAFISYSHVDEKALQRLHTHLAVMRRAGEIDEWFDRKIKVGDPLDKTTMKNLTSSDIFIALVSPDFLASNYCYETEMETAMQLHEQGSMRIVSIIIEPCDWTSTPLQKFKATPKDGKPVSEWSNENTAYVDVVKELRRLVDERNGTKEPKPKKAKAVQTVEKAAPKYRTKKSFDKIDRINFKKETFRTLQSSMSSWIAEINEVEGIKGLYEDSDKTRFFVTLVNRDRNNKSAELTVYISDGDSFHGDINILYKRSDAVNTSNGGFTINEDDYDLFLTPLIMSFNRERKRLDPAGAARYLWENLLERADISRA